MGFSRKVDDVTDADPRRYGRPEFIQQEDFRAPMKCGRLNKLAVIDGILPASFIQREERCGRPIKCYATKTEKLWRMIDIVARARALLLPVTPPAEIVAARSIESMRAEIEALKRERDGIKQQIVSAKADVAIIDAAVVLTGRTLLQEHEIVSAKNPWKSGSGIYFLIKDNRVVYVGQSVSVHSRIGGHKDKDFDHYAYILCGKEILDALESLYIHVLRPPLNGLDNSGKPVAPMRLSDILASAEDAEKKRAARRGWPKKPPG